MKINANGIEQFYELSGKPGAPVVVLSHSLSSSNMMWAPQLIQLEEHFQVLRYDVRGHGRSGVPLGEYSLSQLAVDVIGLLDALAIEHVHFVGLSMGGMIAQTLALQYSQRLCSVALCDTMARIPVSTQAAWTQRIEAAQRDGMASLAEATITRWFSADFIAKNPPILQQIKQQICMTPVAGFIGCCHAISRLDQLEQLASISLPVLIMVGDRDPATPPAEAAAMHAQITDSHLVTLEGALHLSNVEQATVFNQRLLQFLLRQL
ncbi:MAG TPA: 3-oxoadipate enol-lactonase [Gammaproteobacteria bacterium]|nr:3-oxoadipate enol-lactonase [Gammaproteobacteria bacterium]